MGLANSNWQLAISGLWLLLFGLTLGVFFLPLWFLVTGFSPVGNLRQNFTDTLNVSVSPEPNTHARDLRDRRFRNLAQADEFI
jgi:hypothetical protein